MKKRALLFVRILIAVVGVWFILSQIEWGDRVEIRPGTVLSNGTKIQELTLAEVIDGQVRSTGAASPLTVALSASAQTTLSLDELANTDRFVVRPGFKTTLINARIGPLLLGFLVVALIYPLQTWRWSMLLKARGMGTTFRNAFKLTMIGNFASLCLPGAAAGDLLKAWYAAKSSGRYADSAMTVIVDCLSGLLGLIVFAGLASLTMLDDPLGRRIALGIGCGLSIMMLAAAVYSSPTARAKIGLNWLLARLPLREQIQALDQAAVAYRDHKKVLVAAVAMSVPQMFCLCSAAALAGLAMGMDTQFGLLITVNAVVFLSGAIPITPPQGAGVWEYLGKAMLHHPPAVTMNQIVAMLMMVRLYQVFYSLTGSFFMLTGDVKLRPAPAADA